MKKGMKEQMCTCQHRQKKVPAQLSWRSPLNFDRRDAETVSSIFSMRNLLTVARPGQKDSRCQRSEGRKQRLFGS